MSWRKVLAKEWLVFTCSIMDCFIAWNVWLAIAEWVWMWEMNTREILVEVWQRMFTPLFVHGGGHLKLTVYPFDVDWLVTMSPIVLFYFIRSIIWSIKQLKRKEVI